MENTFWRKCGICKREINFNTLYQVCSVSTCRKTVFCSVDCWDQHSPIMNHKSAWAQEERAPAKESATPEQAPRRIIVSSSLTNPAKAATSAMDSEVLIVASKLKQYVKDKYDLNTAANVMEVLSHQVRQLTDRAVEKARAEGRKTLMDRDF